jgi:hypothetical protein
VRVLLRKYRWTVAVGVVAGFVLLLLPWEYCMAGNGYGFPFAWYHPNHQEPGEVAVGNGDMAVEPRNLGVSMVLFGGAVMAAAVADRRRSAAARIRTPASPR